MSKEDCIDCRNYLMIFGIILGVFVLLMASSMVEHKHFKKVKTGEYTLTCQFNDGVRNVPPERILYRSGEVWHFDNGAAKNCSVFKGE